MKLAEYTITAALDRAVAKKLVGQEVSWREPNVSEPGIYRDAETGEAVLMVAPLPGGTTNLRRAVFDTKMASTLRQRSGNANVSRVFGFTTRNVMTQKEACRPTSFTYDHPDGQRTMNETAVLLGDYLQEQLPEVFAEDMERLSTILPEWRMTDNSLWTSGNINQSSQLPYHVDGANFDTWSAMPILRRGMDGGNLHLPEYDVTVDCRDGWAVWFNGFRYVHGVSPMKSRQEDGYRYTVVFYAKRGMKDCHTYAVEVGEARKKRAARELAMAGENSDLVKEKFAAYGGLMSTGSQIPR